MKVLTLFIDEAIEESSRCNPLFFGPKSGNYREKTAGAKGAGNWETKFGLWPEE